MPDPNENDSWLAYQKHVLAELKRLNTNDGEIFKRLNSIDVSIGKLDVRSGLIGAIGGAIPATVALIYFLMNN